VLRAALAALSIALNVGAIKTYGGADHDVTQGALVGIHPAGADAEQGGYLLRGE